MQKFRLRKGLKIGDLAAENDRLLAKAFVDQGHIEALLDTGDPRFLILGRTGSGKTALIKHIIDGRVEHFATINPEELSMRYIHNAPVLKTLIALGANLDVFYKFLWRHICVLEIIRMRYGNDEDVPTLIRQIIDLVSTSKRDESRAKVAAKDYLRSYGDQFWITTDNRIKKMVDEVEVKFTSDHKVSAWLEANPLKFGGENAGSASTRNSQAVEREIVDRVQSIVSDYLLADLRHVVQLLGKAGFNDSQKRYYLFIDDLDKNWMPDDGLYLDLTRSLLHTVYDLNRSSPLQGVKIIVALRENAYHRIFHKAAAHEPQREKWLDVQVRIRWEKEELEALVDNRLREIFRGEYTQAAPTFRGILPPTAKYNRQDPIDFILDRTFMRPRDVIDYTNTALEIAGSVNRLNWTNLRQAETEYSTRRKNSVFDEWKDSYFGLPLLFPLLTRVGPKFTLDDISETDVNQILGSDRCEKCPWLRTLQEQFCVNQIDIAEIKIELIKAMYLVGLIGVKQPGSPHLLYSFDQPLNTSPEILVNSMFCIHKMFWSSLGLTRAEAATA